MSIIGLSLEHSYNVFILEGIEINEQLSLRNSLNALLSVELYELGFSLQNWRLYVWELDIKWLSISTSQFLGCGKKTAWAE